MKKSLLGMLGLLLLLGGIGGISFTMRDKATATPAPGPRGFSIFCVPFDEPAPARHLALVVDPSGNLVLPNSEESGDDAVERAFRPGRDADRITHVKLTVQDEDNTTLETLTKALVYLRGRADPDVLTVITVHLQGSKPDPVPFRNPPKKGERK